MIALIIFGVTLLGITFIIAQRHFDGVVEEKTYEAALKYDETVVNVNNMKKALSNIKAEKHPGGISVSFIFEPSSTAFPDAAVKEARLIRPGNGKDYFLEKSEKGYGFSGEIPPGWYNLQLLCSTGQTDVTISKSLYID